MGWVSAPAGSAGVGWARLAVGGGWAPGGGVAGPASAQATTVYAANLLTLVEIMAAAKNGLRGWSRASWKLPLTACLSRDARSSEAGHASLSACVGSAVDPTVTLSRATVPAAVHCMHTNWHLLLSVLCLGPLGQLLPSSRRFAPWLFFLISVILRFTCLLLEQHSPLLVVPAHTVPPA